MMWNNNKKGTTNWFWWGLVAGAVGSLYIAKKMNGHSNVMQKENQQMNTHENAQQNHQHHPEENRQNTFEGMENKGKDELFETFMNASENEIKEKAKDMNLNN